MAIQPLSSSTTIRPPEIETDIPSLEVDLPTQPVPAKPLTSPDDASGTPSSPPGRGPGPTGGGLPNPLMDGEQQETAPAPAGVSGLSGITVPDFASVTTDEQGRVTGMDSKQLDVSGLFKGIPTETFKPVEEVTDTKTVKTEFEEPTPTQPSEMKETFRLTDPRTGETMDFDDKAKFEKARVNLAKQVEEQKILDEERGITDDLIKSGLSLVQDVVEGNDPVKTAQFNWAIQKMNPVFQAQTAATAMRLKQAGVDPNAPGAGMAIMTQMARQSGKQVSEIVNELNVDSAKRMIELSKWGVQKAMDVQRHRTQQRQDDWNFGVRQTDFLANVIKTDDPKAYDDVFAAMNLPVSVDTSQFIRDIQSQNELDNAAANRTLTADYQSQREMFGSLMPGVAYDQTELSGLPPDQYGDVLSRAQNIANALSKGPAGKEEARQLLLQAQQLYPDVFDADYSNWDPDDFNTLETFNKRQGLESALSRQVFAAGTNAFELEEASQWAADNLIDPATVDQKFNRMWSTMNQSQKDRILELAGLQDDPISLEEKKLALGADQVRGMQDTANPTQRMFDVFFQSASPDFKNWLQDNDGKNEDLFRQYLFELSTGGAASIGPDGNLVVDSRQLLDPTNPDSRLAHYYMDWPKATDSEGNWVEPEQWGITEGTYSGNQPLQDRNMSEADTNYNNEMNQKWENYVRSGGKKPRMEWFTDSQGGTKEVAKGIGEEPPTEQSELLERFPDASEFAVDLVNGEKKLTDLSSETIKNFQNQDVQLLQEAGIIAARFEDGSIPGQLRASDFENFVRDKGLRAEKYYDDGENQQYNFDMGQIVIVGGKVYRLSHWESNVEKRGVFKADEWRVSTIKGINQETGKLETISTAEEDI